MNCASPSRPAIAPGREICNRPLHCLIALPEFHVLHLGALTPVESALARRLLRYKHSPSVSLLATTLTSASNLYQSKGFKSLLFDTLIGMSPVTPLESALTQTARGRGEALHRSPLSRKLLIYKRIAACGKALAFTDSLRLPGSAALSSPRQIVSHERSAVSKPALSTDHGTRNTEHLR